MKMGIHTRYVQIPFLHTCTNGMVEKYMDQLRTYYTKNVTSTHSVLYKYTV